MSFSPTTILTDSRKIIASNPFGSGKLTIINTMRVTNKENTAYHFYLYMVKDAEAYNPALLSRDILDAGDYIIDDTVFEIPEGYHLAARSNISGSVKVNLNGYEKSIQ